MAEHTRNIHTYRHRSGTNDRCPIEDPRYCLAARCQVFGICEHNHPLRERLRVAAVQLPRPDREDRAALRKYVERDMGR
jgi:hypothetical protein